MRCGREQIRKVAQALGVPMTAVEFTLKFQANGEVTLNINAIPQADQIDAMLAEMAKSGIDSSGN
jgi:hypothetical protein